jgi:uncharacterized protein YcfL
MKRAAILIPVLLAACSSTTNQPAYTNYKQQDLVIDRQVQAMSRNEVISAVHDCEGNGLRASMVYAKRQVNGYSVDVVIDVVCAPKYKY